jgi:hypothetical protein
LSCKPVAKGSICIAKSLSCDAVRQRSHNNAWLGNVVFAIRFAKTARQRALPCVPLVVVHSRPLPCLPLFAVHCVPLPCSFSLPCVLFLSCFSLFAVEQPLSCVARQTCMAKPLPCTPARHQGAQVHAMWPICRVYAHGNVTKCPLPCAYTRQRPRYIAHGKGHAIFSVFFLFFIYFLHFKI